MALNETPTIPVVDLSPFTSGGDQEARKAAATELAKKLSINGCIGISGHNIPVDLLGKAFEVTKKLFDLPYHEKMKAPHPDGPTPHRGYSGLGREKATSKTASEIDDSAQKKEVLAVEDYKESYEIGSEENKIQYNIWLPEEVFPGFRQFTTEFFWELDKLVDSILDALIVSLGLPEKEAESVRAIHSGHENQLRLLHYPPVLQEKLEHSTHRLGAHTDWSSFTLLFQDAAGGLEFGDRKSGEFMPATPKEGVLYLNVGDMFQRISNGIYPSSRHRVVIKEANKARYSIPFFVMPKPDGVVEPQPSQVAAVGKQLYEPITFASWSEMMFKTTQIHSAD